MLNKTSTIINNLIIELPDVSSRSFNDSESEDTECYEAICKDSSLDSYDSEANTEEYLALCKDSSLESVADSEDCDDLVEMPGELNEVGRCTDAANVGCNISKCWLFSIMHD